MRKSLGIIGTLLIFIAGIFVKTDYDDKNIIKSILNEKLVFQYGEDVDLKHEDYIFNYDLDSLKDKNDYVKVGKHNLNVSFNYKSKEIEKEVELLVQDTIGPKFTQFKEEFEVFEKEEIENIEKYFKATDLSKVKIKFDLDDVKFDKKGKYVAKAIAQDAHGNITTKSFAVIVKEKPAPPKPQPQPSTPTETFSNYPVVEGATYRGGHVIVNKKHGLPPNFASGENSEAAANLSNLLIEMRSLGMNVAGPGDWAGFRTYEHQEYLYTNYVKNHGQEAADISSAVPGFSEHQTGLAFDLRSPSGVLLQTEPEITWVKDNAHRYGFIVRYPEGKTNITGYKHEPWHLRYLGNDAIKLYEANQTMEEYFNIEG